MGKKVFTSKDKWLVSGLAGLLFLVVSSPYVYTLTNRFLSGLLGSIASPFGCPYILGLIVHTIVFVVIIRVMMR